MVCACSVAQSCQTVIPWTIARKAPLSMVFFRQEHWSGLPFPPPGDLADSGTEFASPASSALTLGFFTSEPPGKPIADGTIPHVLFWIHF